MSGAPRRLARVLDSDGRLCLVRLEGDMLQPVRGDLLGMVRDHGEPLPRSAAIMLSPVRPGTIVVVTDAGRLQLKPPSSVIGPGDTIRIPPGAAEVRAHTCVAAVIRRALSGPTAVPREHILGRTILNDVVSLAHGALLDGGGFDSFCPLGPWIEEGVSEALAAAVGRAGEVLTLMPGDVVALRTGTQQSLSAGALCRVEIPGLGVLENPVGSEHE